MPETVSTPESGTIESFKYDDAERILTVKFRSGATYAYPDTAPQTFEGMKASDSKGRYFAANLRGQRGRKV